MAALPGLPNFMLPPVAAAPSQQAAPLQPALLGFPGAAPLQPLDPQHTRLLPPAAVQALQLGLPPPGSAGAAGLPPLPQEQAQDAQQQQRHPHLQYSLETLAPHQMAAVTKAAQAVAAALAAGGGGDLLYVNPRQLAAIQRRREKRARQEQRMLQLVAKEVSSGHTQGCVCACCAVHAGACLLRCPSSLHCNFAALLPRLLQSHTPAAAPCTQLALQLCLALHCCCSAARGRQSRWQGARWPRSAPATTWATLRGEHELKCCGYCVLLFVCAWVLQPVCTGRHHPLWLLCCWQPAGMCSKASSGEVPALPSSPAA